jgi:hypothetical protein
LFHRSISRLASKSHQLTESQTGTVLSPVSLDLPAKRKEAGTVTASESAVVDLLANPASASKDRTVLVPSILQSTCLLIYPSHTKAKPGQSFLPSRSICQQSKRKQGQSLLRNPPSSACLQFPPQRAKTGQSLFRYFVVRLASKSKTNQDSPLFRFFHQSYQTGTVLSPVSLDLPAKRKEAGTVTASESAVVGLLAIPASKSEDRTVLVPVFCCSTCYQIKN